MSALNLKGHSYQIKKLLCAVIFKWLVYYLHFNTKIYFFYYKLMYYNLYLSYKRTGKLKFQKIFWQSNLIIKNRNKKYKQLIKKLEGVYSIKFDKCMSIFYKINL